jgi:hypothetical protein
MTHADLAALPVAEKIQLMEALWDSLCDDPAAAAAIPAWHGEVLAERALQLDQGSEELAPWNDAKQSIRDQITKL